MIDIKNIFPECDADTLLVRLITQRGNANHCKGISKVINELESRKNQNSYLIGIVDSDKFKRKEDLKYLKLFSESVCDLVNNNEGITIHKIPNKEHYIIYIHTEFEVWAWKQALLAGLNTNEFGFADIKEFYKESKHFRTNESAKFKRFVNAIVIENPPGVKLLKEWLIVEN